MAPEHGSHGWHGATNRDNRRGGVAGPCTSRASCGRSVRRAGTRWAYGIKEGPAKARGLCGAQHSDGGERLRRVTRGEARNEATKGGPRWRLDAFGLQCVGPGDGLLYAVARPKHSSG